MAPVRRRTGLLFVALAIVLAAAIAAVILKTGACSGRIQASSKILAVQDKPKGSVDLSTAVSRVATQNMPAVVYIQVKQTRTIENPLFPFQNDPFFRRYFGIPRMPRRFRQEVMGVGSGMILDQKGNILTNSHVTANATEMVVIFHDGARHNAQLVGSDPKTDLAVIRIALPSKQLVNVVFGDSDKLEVGEWVVAIGAPQAFQKSVTQGIISAKHRTGISDPTGYQDFLQTDASINPGNSGGPLINMHGQVIGVNAAIATSSGGFEGIGFTIPSNIAVYVAKELIKNGKIERGWLGVTIRDVPTGEAAAGIARAAAGSLVENVAQGGPAQKGGLGKGDIIVAVNGKEVANANDLRNKVSQIAPGTVVTLTVLRGGKERDVKVTAGSEKEAAQSIAASLQRRLGGQFRSPAEAEIQRYGLTSGLGAIITSVERGGPLDQGGFEVNDGILGINDHPVAGVEGLSVILDTLEPGQKISVTVLDHRTGGTGKIAITLR